MKTKLLFLLLFTAKAFGQDAITQFEYLYRNVLSPVAYRGQVGNAAFYEGPESQAMLVTSKGVFQLSPLPGQVAMSTWDQELYRIVQENSDMRIEAGNGETRTVKAAKFVAVFGDAVYFQKEGFLCRARFTDGQMERIAAGEFQLKQLENGTRTQRYIVGEKDFVFSNGQVLRGKLPPIHKIDQHNEGILLTVGEEFAQFWLEKDSLIQVGFGNSGYVNYSRGKYFLEVGQGPKAHIKISTLGLEGKTLLHEKSITTAMNLIYFAFSHHVAPYFEPQVLDDQLVFLGDKEVHGYYSDSPNKELSLYQIDLLTGTEYKINADSLVPGGTYYPIFPFRTEISAAGKLRIFSTKDVHRVHEYDPVSRSFTRRTKTGAERAGALAVFDGTRISLEKEHWVFWDSRGEPLGRVPFPVLKSKGEAVEHIREAFGQVWITHRWDNEAVRVSRYDGKSLYTYSTQIPSAHPLRISAGEEGASRLMVLDDRNTAYAYLLDQDSLTLVGTGANFPTVGPHFSFRSLGDRVYHLWNAGGDQWVIYGGKMQQAKAVFKAGYVKDAGGALVYVPYRSGEETVLGKGNFGQAVGRAFLHWVDADGYHKFDGKMTTVEKMTTSGIRPRLSKISEKYVAVQVNSKVLVVDLENGNERSSALPVESIVGNWYFEQDGYIYGVSTGKSSVYRYSLSTGRVEQVKNFSPAYHLAGDKKILARLGKQTEVWEIIQGKLRKTLEFTGHLSGPPSTPQISAEGKYVDLSQGIVLDFPLEREARWLDSVQTTQFFSSAGRLWSWNTHTLEREDLGEYQGVFLQGGHAVYYLQDERIRRMQGQTRVDIAHQPGRDLVLNAGYLYWKFGGQVWRIAQPDVWENGTDPDYLVYPNPTYDRLYIRGSGAQENLRIFTPEGKLLLQKGSIQKEGIDVSKFQAGLYFIQIGGQTFRFIKAF